VPVILVTVVQTIVVAIADVDPWYAVAIVAGEQIPEACASFRFAVIWWFIGSIATVIVTITVPGSWNASVVGTPETVGWTSSLATMQWILVGVVTTIVVAIAQPIGFHADVGLLALQMIRRTSGVHGTPFVRFIRCGIILAVIHTIAHLSLWNTPSIGASELTIHTRWIDAAQLIGTILAVVLVITLPRLKDAASVVAAELVGGAGVIGTIVGILVGVVATVVVAIAGPHSRNASAVLAVEFAGLASIVSRGTHPSLVHHLGAIVALALGLAIRGRMTALGTSAVVDPARIHIALLAIGTVDANISRRILQSLHHLHHVGSSVLLSPIDTSQLKIRPVDVVPEHGYGERINGGCHQKLSILTVQIGSLDLLSHRIRPV